MNTDGIRPALELDVFIFVLVEVEGFFSRGGFVEDGADPPDVGSGADEVAARLFGAMYWSVPAPFLPRPGGWTMLRSSTFAMPRSETTFEGFRSRWRMFRRWR